MPCSCPAPSRPRPASNPNEGGVSGNNQERLRVAAAEKGTKQLHLSDQRITPIPEGVFPTLTVLTTLNLYRCDSLATLPESLGQLRALTTLYLGNGRSLTAESPGQLRALTELYLGDCTRLSVESLK